MWFPSTCPNFCLVGADLMVPLKNIWTVVKKIGRLFPTVGDFAAWWLQNMLSLSYSFWLVLALLSSLSDEGRW